MPLACFIVFFIANEWCSVISWLQPSYQLLNSNIFLLYTLEVYICYFIVTCVLFARKVVFGEDEIAYQIGETTEILSRSYLCATPHCVRVLSIIHFLCFGRFWKIFTIPCIYCHKTDSKQCKFDLSCKVLFCPQIHSWCRCDICHVKIFIISRPIICKMFYGVLSFLNWYIEAYINQSISKVLNFDSFQWTGALT